MQYLETKGFKITYVEVDHTGKVNVDLLKQAITPETTLITIMHANNEVPIIVFALFLRLEQYNQLKRYPRLLKNTIFCFTQMPLSLLARFLQK